MSIDKFDEGGSYVAGAKDSSLSKLLNHFNDTANGIIFFVELHFFVSFLSRFVFYSFSASNSLQGGTHAPWSALSLLIHNRDNKPSLLSVRGARPDLLTHEVR